MREKKKPELLMPAGSLELLKTVIAYGADAVYLGGETMSLRAKAQNFTIPEIKEGIRYAHEHGAKVYVAANIFAHNDDMKKAMKFFLLLKQSALPDALIISDPGVYTLAKSLLPEVRFISAPRRITRTSERTSSGMSRASAVSYPRESFLCRSWREFVRRFRMIWRSRVSSTEPCASLIPAAA